MRKHLLEDFTKIWHLDLHGNVRQNPKLSGTAHNVFGIQVGVGITVAVRNAKHIEKSLSYHRVPKMWRRTEKLAFLTSAKSISAIVWQDLKPDVRHTWRTEGLHAAYDGFIPVGTRESKAIRAVESKTIFRSYSRGAETNRDTWVYDFRRDELTKKIQRFIETYNSEVDKWKRQSPPSNIDDFVLYDDSRIKWSRDLKLDLRRGRYAEFNDIKVRSSLYRPFGKRWLFFDRILNQEVNQLPRFFPVPANEAENVMICLTDIGSEKPFMLLMSNTIVDLHLVGAGSSTQCFPFYTYNEDGSGRRENITEWALGTFRERYGAAVTKRDIFHYVYALLHHPEYRSRYAENLKRDLPRVPLVPDAEAFRAFVAAGAALADLHLGYEAAEPYRLERIIAQGATAKSLFHVQKMKLSKDKSAVIVNPHLTLSGILPEAFQYRLGNRSALEWVLDQYRISTDARSGITSDPNRPDDPEYIVRLIGQVVAVGVATVAIVAGLSPLPEVSLMADRASDASSPRVV